MNTDVTMRSPREAEVAEAAQKMAALRAELAAAAGGASPRVVLVSKTRGVDEILPFLEAGERDFGENYASEAEVKWPALLERYPDVRLHYIGVFQRSKVPFVVKRRAAVHGLDDAAAAEALVRRQDKEGVLLPVFVQVNVGREAAKGGVPPEGALPLAELALRLGADVRGFMAVPPAGQDPAPYFADLRALAQKAGLAELSMGMSDDRLVAAREGSTCVRIGSLIFGARARNG